MPLVLVVILLAGSVSAQGGNQDGGERFNEHSELIARAKVLEVSTYQEVDDSWYFVGKQEVTVEVLAGRFKGHVEVLENYFTDIPHQDILLKPGDQVLLLLELDEGRLQSVSLYELARDRYLYILFGLFFFAVILIARLKGLKVLLALLIAGMIVLYGVLPLFLQGVNPLVLTLLASVAILVATGIIFGGFHLKTVAAVVGALGGVLGAGLMALLFSHVMRLTGFSEGIQVLYSGGMPTNLDLQGLLFAGVVVGALGAVIDLSLATAGAVFQEREANLAISLKALFQAGYSTGKERLTRLIYVLFIAYVGCALPLFLLFALDEISFLNAINLDLVATEVVRAIAGGFGLLATAPISAISASLLVKLLPGKVRGD